MKEIIAVKTLGITELIMNELTKSNQKTEFSFSESLLPHPYAQRTSTKIESLRTIAVQCS